MGLSVVSERKVPHLSFCKVNCIYNAFGARLIRGRYQVILIPCGNTCAMYTKPEYEGSGGQSYILSGCGRKTA